MVSRGHRLQDITDNYTLDQITCLIEKAGENRKWELIETGNVLRMALITTDKAWSAFSKRYVSASAKRRKKPEETVLSDKKICFLNSMLKGF